MARLIFGLRHNIVAGIEMPFRREIDEGRVMRGQQICKLEGQIARLDDGTYQVKSQAGHGLYTVVKDNHLRAWRCSCPDHIYREVKCKHIWAVEFSQALRAEVSNQVVIRPLDITKCLYCDSQTLVRDGLRHNKNGDIQRFTCKNCGKRFVRNLGFERLKATPQIVTSALQLYFTGESLRNTKKFLRLQGVEVSHQTIYNWIKRYTALMEKYLDKITPQVSDTWRADELYMKFHGNMKYVFAMMDDETRFWIAQEVADTKDTHDARHLFQMAKDRAGKKPQILITDGLRSYHDAWLKEFRTNKLSDSTVHIRQITLAGQHNNNKMERMNGEIRDRERVTRNLKKPDGPILTGLQIYHNYIRPHEALDGKTPSEVAGIEVKGQDKWLTIIQNASKQNGPKR
ncbi:MAG: DDE-type integrase/transposase/recombinase [Candidatus Bathyarchaeia archaeon]